MAQIVRALAYPVWGPGLMVYNPNTQEAQAGGYRVWAQPGLYSIYTNKQQQKKKKKKKKVGGLDWETYYSLFTFICHLKTLPQTCVMDLGSHNLVKEFTKTDSRRKQRLIRTPLKRMTKAGGYAKEHSCWDRVENRFYTSHRVRLLSTGCLPLFVDGTEWLLLPWVMVWISCAQEHLQLDPSFFILPGSWYFFLPSLYRGFSSVPRPLFFFLNPIWQLNK
jgi:hypothetical protein